MVANSTKNNERKKGNPICQSAHLWSRRYISPFPYMFLLYRGDSLIFRIDLFNKFKELTTRRHTYWCLVWEGFGWTFSYVTSTQSRRVATVYSDVNNFEASRCVLLSSGMSTRFPLAYSVSSSLYAAIRTASGALPTEVSNYVSRMRTSKNNWNQTLGLMAGFIAIFFGCLFWGFP